PNSVLAPEVETFPEAFRRQGFRTAGFTEGGYMSGRFGFRRGFEQFAARARNRNRPLHQTFRRGVRFLEGLKPDERFLLFLHTYSVHTPYDAPEEYRKPFWPGEPPAGAIPATGPAFGQHNASGGTLPEPVVGWLTALYDAGISQTDEVLRGFFADLERLGLADDVTVIVTSDHGEELQDHGRLNHEQLYRETMRVPLLVIHPDQRTAVRHGGVVQLVDLAPTLYELARVQPKGKPTGTSLAGLLGSPAAPRPGSAWMEGFGARAVYRGEQRRLDSLLLFDQPEGTWVSRSVAVDTPGGRELSFQARSYQEPRRLTVRQGDAVLAEVALTPEWTPVRLPLPNPGRLRLEADGCAVAAPEREHDKWDVRCQAFQVRGLRLSHVEVYDVSQDPGQRRDLSRERTRETRMLLRDLLAFNPKPVAEATTQELDPELEKNLRALGYLQ
ncbi:MAG TPA: sulfatase-like hydrolase/transferase, partial [Thermoanaerobaculia bacterium]|nr:sulfatase-like hydrolase/transferase [Thermoanaerobaculia bacterium]